MTNTGGPPGDEEFELTLLGPGYGESIVLHVGNCVWVVVDSCLDAERKPGALSYLNSIGVNSVQGIALIVATHWHDDHIRGMAHLVESCPDAQFCCASALCREEFLTVAGTLEDRRFSASGSGLREIHRVFSRLAEVGKRPAYALSSRVVFRNETCTISSLSPDDETFQRFLTSVGRLIPSRGKNKTRIRSLYPNEVAVVLWVECGGNSLLLGADMGRRGWAAIVEDTSRPVGKASVFKIPHHGSEGADEPAVWERMLEDEPFAVLTPWRRGSGVLPTKRDVERIQRATSKAWITNNGLPGQSSFRHENKTVERTLRESGVRIRRLVRDSSFVRLRRSINASDQWMVETFGNACHLSDYAA